MSDWGINESKTMSQEKLKELYEDTLSVMANEKDQKVEPYFSVGKYIRAILVFISVNHIPDIILPIITSVQYACIMSVQYARGMQYNGGCSVHWKPQCTERPPVYSWYPLVY